MKRLAKNRLKNLVGGALCMLFFTTVASAGDHPAHPYRYSVVDIPVSLAQGTVRTPEFSPRKTSWHWILLQVERPLPPSQMRCMVGVEDGTDDAKSCAEEQLIDADWTVLCDGQVVEQGSSHGFGAAKFTKENIFKFLGKFPALAGKKYVLEVKFTKDGTALNVANPHLIVTKIGEE